MVRTAAAAFLLLLTVSAAAADSTVIARVEVVAPGLADPAQLLATLGLAEGQPLDRSRLRHGLQVLYAAGEVEQLSVDAVQGAAGLEVTVDADLRPRVARVEVDAPGVRLRSRVRDWLDLRPGVLLAEGKVELHARLLLRRLRDYGFSRARVEPFVDLDRTSNRAVVTVVAEPGPVERLGQVLLEGVPAELEAAVGSAASRPGARLSAAQVERTRRRAEAELRRAGFWEAEVGAVERQAGVDGAVDLLLRVSPGPRYRLEIVAAGEDQELVRSALPDPVEEDLHAAQTEALAEQIRIALQDRGYLLAQVGVDLEGADLERVVRVAANPGRRLRVAAVELPGATSIRRKRLDATLTIHPGRVGGWRGQRVSEATLEADRLALVDLYLGRGFAEVEVDPARLEPVGGDSVRVTFVVREGARWVLTDLRLEGLPVEAAAALERSDLGLAEGGPWDARAVSPAERRLELILAGAGYPEGRVKTEVDTSQPGAARVVLRAETGPFVRFAEVVVAGLSATRPGVVRRALERAEVRPGEPASREALLAAQKQLSELGLFRRVGLEPIPGQERRSDRGLVVRCEEGPQRSYLLGLGWDTEAGARITLGWSHLNLLGGAHAVTVETRLSGREQRFQLSLREPPLPGIGLPGYAAVYRTEEDFATFSLLRRGLWLEVGDRRSRPLRRWLRYEYQVVQPDAPPEILSELERQEQQIQLASLTPVLEWDARDDPLNPTHGLLGSTSLEWAFPLFSAEARFLKLQGALSLYGPLLGGTASLGLRVGAIRPIAAAGAEPANLEVPLATRFFAGGRTTHRAFATDRLGIEGQTLADGEPVGGTALLLVNLEYLRTLHGPIAAALFLDGGNVWAEPQLFELSDLRWGLGSGLSYETPAGPLRLEYGWKLDRKPGESRGQLYLSFGTAF